MTGMMVMGGSPMDMLLSVILFVLTLHLQSKGDERKLLGVCVALFIFLLLWSLFFPIDF